MSINVYTSQRLTSGDRPLVNIVDGFSYSGGPTEGVSYRRDFTILNTNFNALAWRFELGVNGAFIAAIVGPGWATGTFDNELHIGLNPDQTIRLGGAAPYTEAGILFGLSVQFAFRLRITGWVGVRWVGGWRGRFENIWGTITDTNRQAEIDLIEVIVALITVLNNRRRGPENNRILDTLSPAQVTQRANWSMRARTNNQLGAVTESATNLLPQIAVRLDIAEFVPSIRALNAALDRVGCTVQFGPTIGIGFPINVQVEGIVVEGAVFNVTGTQTVGSRKFFTGSQNNRLSGGIPSGLGTAGYRPTTVGFRYRWGWGVDLSIGMFARIDIFFVISVNPQFNFGLLGVLGIDTTIQSGIRGNLTNRNFGFNRTASRGGPVEVVFEDPEPVGA